MRIDTALTPDTFFPQDARGKTVIVIDVLRASTTIITALGNGAKAVVPVAEPEEARRIYRTYRPGEALLCGEREGRKIKGFDLGNSPAEYNEEAVRGKTLVFTSTNGSRAMVRAKEARALLIAGFVNAGAVVRRILYGNEEAGRVIPMTEARQNGTGKRVKTGKFEEDILIVCSGREGRFSLEDAVCAGMIVDLLLKAARRPFLKAGDRETGDEARGAQDLYHVYAGDLPGMIRNTLHGRYLASIGMSADLGPCSELNSCKTVPVRHGYQLIAG